MQEKQQLVLYDLRVDLMQIIHDFKDELKYGEKTNLLN